jgi:hypothetical protein
MNIRIIYIYIYRERERERENSRETTAVNHGEKAGEKSELYH